MEENFTTLKLRNASEETLEESLRPNNLGQVIGRNQEKDSLKVMIQSAKKRKRSLDHILFHGPPGLGKTTLAFVVANEMNVPMHVTSGTAIEKGGDLAAVLTSLEPHSILFIDEIHRLKRTLEEILYPAMEDNAIDIVIGKGPNAKTLRLDLPEFTIIGATTRLSSLSSPLRDRFGMSFRLDFYSEEELTELIHQKAQMLKVKIEDGAAKQIAGRSRMTARIAIRILKRVRDLAVVKDVESIDAKLVNEALNMLGIDEHGLSDIDRSIVVSLLKNFENKPVGLNTLAASISEEPDTLESVYEPFLLKIGFLKRTAKGRVLTDRAIKAYGDTIDYGI